MNLPSLLLLTLVWAVWNESYTWETLGTGMLLSFLTLILTNRFLLKESYAKSYAISPLKFFAFTGVLFIEIFKSGFHALKIILTDRIHLGVVDLPTKIEDPLIGTLVATAITLTPGTVTIDYSPGLFKVVWIDCETTDPEQAGEIIKGHFERALGQERKQP